MGFLNKLIGVIATAQAMILPYDSQPMTNAMRFNMEDKDKADTITNMKFITEETDSLYRNLYGD